MLGLWKSKKRKAEEEKNDLKAIVTEDLLGKSDWNESKIGYLTGLSSVGRVAGNIATGVAQSFGRLGLTFKLLTKADDNLPSLPEVDEEDYDGGLRFRAAMHLHGVKSQSIHRALTNTRRSAFFYGALTVLAGVWWLVDYLVKDQMALTTVVLHIAPIPVLAAFCFKAAFTNWMFRHQRLESPKVFIKSMDWMPRA